MLRFVKGSLRQLSCSWIWLRLWRESGSYKICFARFLQGIAAVYPFADPVAIICNDDGKLMGLPLNRALRDENGEMYDAVAGDFLVVGLGEEDFASLIPELAQKYEQLFHQPEVFLKLGNRLLVLPVPDEPPTEKPRTKPPAEHDR